MPRSRTALAGPRTRTLAAALSALGLAAAIAATPALAVPTPWISPAVDLSATGQSAAGPQVAANAAGTTAAAWYRSDGANSRIQASIHTPGAAFAAPVDVSAAGVDANDPQLAVAPDGAVTVAWRQVAGGFYVVWVSTRPPGGSFSTPVPLSAAGQTAQAVRVAADASGATTIVWSRFDGANYVVQFSTRPSGGSFSAPVDISVAGASATDPELTTAPDGTVTVVWRRFDGANDVVQAATRPPGGAFSAPVNLSATGQDAFFPEPAGGSDGSVTVVWRRSDGTYNRIQASTRPAGGSFSAPVDLSAAGADANSAQVATAPDGTTTAVFYRFDGANNIAQASTRPPGGSFAPAVDVSVPGRDAEFTSVGVASDGTTIASWRRSNGTSFIAQASTRPPGGAFGSPIDLSATGADAAEPRLAVADEGSAAVVWTRFNGTSIVVQSAFTAGAPAVLRAPTVTGAAAVGSTLSCDPGAWSGASTVTASWYRGVGQAVAGSSYQVTAADQGTALVCRSLAVSTFGVAESLSAPVNIPGPPAPPAQPAPDRTAPVLTVLTKTRLTRAQFRNGVSVRISANEPTTVLAELVARYNGARISAVPYNLVLGSRTARRVQNSVTLRIRPNRAVVGKKARSFSVRLRLTAEDAAGNRRVTGKTIKVAG